MCNDEGIVSKWCTVRCFNYKRRSYVLNKEFLCNWFTTYSISYQCLQQLIIWSSFIISDNVGMYILNNICIVKRKVLKNIHGFAQYPDLHKNKKDLPKRNQNRNSPKHLERFVCLSMKTFADMMFPKGWNVWTRSESVNSCGRW